VTVVGQNCCRAGSGNKPCWITGYAKIAPSLPLSCRFHHGKIGGSCWTGAARCQRSSARRAHVGGGDMIPAPALGWAEMAERRISAAKLSRVNAGRPTFMC
jgi:hypothetical protein